MTPRIGFRTDQAADSIAGIPPVPGTSGTVHAASATSSRKADYAYRIAALTAGLILLATVV